MTLLDNSEFGLPIPEGAPKTCLLCGFYATEDAEAQQEKHFEETGHGTFEYV